MVPLAAIDKLVKQKMDQIERKLRWNPSVKVCSEENLVVGLANQS